MNTQQNMKTALFMILLVISMPIYSAQVFASITTYTTSSSGTKNYRSATDTTTVIAEIDQSGVSASDVRLITQQNNPFTSCTFAGGKSTCKYDFTSGTWPAGSYDYRVSYQSQQATNKIVVDNRAPNVTINSLVSASQIEVNYNIRERAFSDNPLQCAGIKTVNFILGGQIIKTLNLNLESGTNCDYLNKITKMNATSTNGEEKNFCVEAIDNVGNRDDACRKVVVDREAGNVLDLQAFTTQGQPINYVASRTGPVNAILRFNLDEYDLDKVVADASEFTINDNQKVQQRGKAVSCTPKSCSGNCVCEVPIVLNMPQGGNPALNLEIYDKSNPKADVSVPTHIRADNTPPKVVSIDARQCGDIDAIGKTGNTITSIIEETESGIASGKVYLDLSSVLGSQYSGVRPNSCTQSGNNWLCKWGPFNANAVTGSNLRINIVSPSQDDAGNPMQVSENTIFYDSQNPTFNTYSITAATSANFGEEIQQYPTGGGTLQLTVKASDELPITAIADFSHVAHVGKVSTSCSGTINQTCVFSEIGPLYQGPLFDVPIPVNITDCAGNIQSTIVKINISRLDNAPSNYWDYNVKTPMPTRLERQTLKIFNHRIYFPIDVIGSSSMTPIVQHVVECRDKTAVSYLGFNSFDQRAPDLMGAPRAGVEAIFGKITVERGKNPPDSISVSCTIKTISRSSNGFITQPEFDNVTFTIPFYNSELGAIDKATQDKIDKVKDSALVKGQIIGDIQKVFDFFNKICNVWGVFLQVDQTVSLVTAAMGGVATVFPPFHTVSEGFKNSVNTPLHTFTTANPISKFISGTCDFVSCKRTLSEFVPFLPNLDTVKKYKGDVLFDTHIEPRDSLVMSAATLCIPGIIYNLQKARAVECNYIYCMQTQVPGGLPPFACEWQRASAWCKEVWGEFFQVVPFTEFIDGGADFLKKTLTDPVYAVSIVLGVLCYHPPAAIAGVCTNVKLYGERIRAASNLILGKSWKGAINQFKGSTDNICDIALGKK